jgi:hypothetical protein
MNAPTQTPALKKRSAKCGIDVGKLPITRFEMTSDRNGYKSARARQSILEKISLKADPDGTGSFVSDEYLRSRTGFTRRHIMILRQNLKDLGLLNWTVKTRFQGTNHYTVTPEEWPNRRLIGKIMAGPNGEVSDSNGEVPEPNSEVSRSNGEVSEGQNPSNGEVQTSHNRPVKKNRPVMQPTNPPRMAGRQGRALPRFRQNQNPKSAGKENLKSKQRYGNLYRTSGFIPSSGTRLNTTMPSTCPTLKPTRRRGSAAPDLICW